MSRRRLMVIQRFLGSVLCDALPLLRGALATARYFFWREIMPRHPVSLRFPIGTTSPLPPCHLRLRRCSLRLQQSFLKPIGSNGWLKRTLNRLPGRRYRSGSSRLLQPQCLMRLLRYTRRAGHTISRQYRID
jgi:hypothetical protein